MVLCTQTNIGDSDENDGDDNSNSTENLAKINNVQTKIKFYQRGSFTSLIATSSELKKQMSVNFIIGIAYADTQQHFVCGMEFAIGYFYAVQVYFICCWGKIP